MLCDAAIAMGKKKKFRATVFSIAKNLFFVRLNVDFMVSDIVHMRRIHARVTIVYTLFTILFTVQYIRRPAHTQFGGSQL